MKTDGTWMLATPLQRKLDRSKVSFKMISFWRMVCIQVFEQLSDNFKKVKALKIKRNYFQKKLKSPRYLTSCTPPKQDGKKKKTSSWKMAGYAFPVSTPKPPRKKLVLMLCYYKKGPLHNIQIPDCVSVKPRIRTAILFSNTVLGNARCRGAWRGTDITKQATIHNFYMQQN